MDKLDSISLISKEEIALINKLTHDDIMNRPYLVGKPLTKEIVDLIEG